MKWDKLSPDFKKRLIDEHPEDFSQAGIRPVGSVANPERKPDQRSKGQDSLMETRPAGVRFRVDIISIRRRLVDGDNLQTGAKPLRDSIAHWLRTDDADRFITWEYHQLETRGEEGTIVKICTLTN
jgi:hypothetical protein